jgi:hypothetical protein
VSQVLVRFGRCWTADATQTRVAVPADRPSAAEPSEGTSNRFPDLEKPVRGAARHGQTERAVQFCTRAVTHDLGALELRADDERRQQTAEIRGALLPPQGGSAPSTRL